MRDLQTLYKKNDKKYGVSLSLQISSLTFVVRRRIPLDIIEKVRVSSCAVAVIVARF